MTTPRVVLVVVVAVAVAAGGLVGCTAPSRSVTTQPVAATGPSTRGGALTTPSTGEPATTGSSIGSTGATVTDIGPPARTAPSTTTTIRPRSGTPAVLTITVAQDRATFTLRVGQRAKLLLDNPENQWTNVGVAPDGLLRPEPSPHPPPHGQLVIWTALARGTVRITAVGTAWCADGGACPMYARLFGVTLVIA